MATTALGIVVNCPAVGLLMMKPDIDCEPLLAANTYCPFLKAPTHTGPAPVETAGGLNVVNAPVAGETEY